MLPNTILWNSRKKDRGVDDMPYEEVSGVLCKAASGISRGYIKTAKFLRDD